MPFLVIASLRNPAKQYKLSSITIAHMMNIGEDAQNSIISYYFSYRVKHASSPATLAVITNHPESSTPDRQCRIVSMKASRQELVLLYSYILWSFYHPNIVPPDHTDSWQLSHTQMVSTHIHLIMCVCERERGREREQKTYFPH